MTDLAQLQGRWRQVSFAENGIANPPDTHSAPGAITTITGRMFHVAVPGGATIIAGRFTLNPAATPPEIDWIDSIGADAGRVLPAIYHLSDRHFGFAAADAGHSRPRDFQGGPGITIRQFVRV